MTGKKGISPSGRDHQGSFSFGLMRAGVKKAATKTANRKRQLNHQSLMKTRAAGRKKEGDMP